MKFKDEPVTPLPMLPRFLPLPLAPPCPPSPLAVVRQMSMCGVVLLLVAFLCSSCTPAAETPAGDDADVRTFLNRYFSTWSAKDMDGYGECFHPQARISFIHQGEPHSDGFNAFLHSQKIAHASAAAPMTEIPTGMKIVRDERTAQASVRWKLTKGNEVVTGTDCFTLIKTSAGWKILSLVFYND